MGFCVSQPGEGNAGQGLLCSSTMIVDFSALGGWDGLHFVPVLLGKEDFCSELFGFSDLIFGQ